MQNKKIKIKDPEGRRAEPLSWAVGLSITKLKRPGTTFPFVSKLPPKGQTRSLRSLLAGDSWLFMNEGLLLSLNHSTRQSCQQDPRQLRSHGRLQESREVAWPPLLSPAPPQIGDKGQHLPALLLRSMSSDTPTPNSRLHVLIFLIFCRQIIHPQYVE